MTKTARLGNYKDAFCPFPKEWTKSTNLIKHKDQNYNLLYRQLYVVGVSFNFKVVVTHIIFYQSMVVNKPKS